MSKLVLIRGLPGSGKSTHAEFLKDAALEGGINIEHYEADQYFINADGEYVFDINNLCEAHSECQSKTDASLADGKSVIVSNTFTTIKELKPYFNIAAKYGIIPHVIVMQTNYGSIHDVPDKTLIAMKKRFVWNIDSLFNSHKEV